MHQYMLVELPDFRNGEVRLPIRNEICIVVYSRESGREPIRRPDWRG